jgi:hypothetical protein
MNLEQLVPLIHATPNKGVVIPTGGGTRVFPMLLELGGGSNTLLHGEIPYKEFMTDAILGGKPDKYVSEQTARQLAMAAYQKALEIRTKDDVNYPVFGVACTVSLQKTPEERGGRKHYIYAALQTGMKTVAVSAEIDPAATFPGQNAFAIRAFEEMYAAGVLVNLIAEACGLSERLSQVTECPYVTLTRRESTIHCGYFPELLDGTVKALLYDPVEGFSLPLEKMSENQYVLPGSFRPAHDAHFEMADYVENTFGGGSSTSGGECFFELSIRNAAKPPLDFISLEERLKTTRNRRVWITNAPTFKDKAKIFPGARFVVGYDTAARIVDPKYADINEVIQAFTESSVIFAVFGRSVNGKYQYELDQLPDWFRNFSFQVDYVLPSCAVSSTGIRAAERAVGTATGSSSAGLESGQTQSQGREEGNQR